jgi:hypothetical protein
VLNPPSSAADTAKRHPRDAAWTIAGLQVLLPAVFRRFPVQGIVKNAKTGREGKMNLNDE